MNAHCVKAYSASFSPISFLGVLEEHMSRQGAKSAKSEPDPYVYTRIRSVIGAAVEIQLDCSKITMNEYCVNAYSESFSPNSFLGDLGVLAAK
jgi:hypothetical protein